MEENKKTYSEAAEPEEKTASTGESKLSEKELETVSGGARLPCSGGKPYVTKHA